MSSHDAEPPDDTIVFSHGILRAGTPISAGDESPSLAGSLPSAAKLADGLVHGGSAPPANHEKCRQTHKVLQMDARLKLLPNEFQLLFSAIAPGQEFAAQAHRTRTAELRCECASEVRSVAPCFYLYDELRESKSTSRFQECLSIYEACVG
jgi:hypothetical protein